MNKLSPRSMQYLSILIAICLVFIIAVKHAFDYLPENQTSGEYEEIISEETDTVEVEKKESEEADFDDENIDSPVITKKSQPEKKIEPLEIISDEELNEEPKPSPEIVAERVTDKAENYKKNKEYSLAITEYQKIIANTDDTKLKAQCYEEISILYATLKRYGSALSAAQKAYNLSPSTAREVLLARLYYKTGEIDKATTRVNNILRRDFNIND